MSDHASAVQPLSFEQADSINERIAGVDSDLAHAIDVLTEIRDTWPISALSRACSGVEDAREALTEVFAEAEDG